MTVIVILAFERSLICTSIRGLWWSVSVVGRPVASTVVLQGCCRIACRAPLKFLLSGLCSLERKQCECCDKPLISMPTACEEVTIIIPDYDRNPS